MLVTYILLALIASCVLLFFSWRFASRRRALPCPSWLRWLVELDSPCAAPFFETILNFDTYCSLQVTSFCTQVGTT